MNVNRTELVEQLSTKYGYRKDAATQIIDDFCKVVLENLEQGNTVSIYGFGIFDMLERQARSCPNPVTGETCYIPTHWVPRFYPGARMRVAVKKWEDNVSRGLK